MELAEQLRSDLSKPFVIGSQEFRMDARYGVAIPETYDFNVDELTHDAQPAAFHAKQDSKQQILKFNHAMREGIEDKAGFRSELRRALDQDEIVISLQPILDLQDRSLVGAEVLLQWLHPERGYIPASSFISLAIETNLVNEIDQRVFQKSCAAMRMLQDQGFKIPLHINLFPGFLHSDNAVRQVRNIIGTAGISAQSFVIEITENDDLLTDSKTHDHLA